MEAIKPPKTELIAIYRLEFYKKQKSWKLSTDAKKKKRKIEKIRNPLNLTYDVENPKTEAYQLNEAFIDTDSDKSVSTSNPQLCRPITPIRLENTTRDYHNAIYTLQEKEQITGNYPHGCLDARLESPARELKNAWTEDNLICFRSKQDYVDFNSCSDKGDPGCWLDNNKNWCPMPDFGKLWPKDIPHNVNALNNGDNAENISSALDWRRDDPSWLPDYDDLRWKSENVHSYAEGDCDGRSDNSIDSLGEFMRGADVAPHSSEIELRLPNDINDSDLTATSLACLSSAQLTAAVWSHTRVLRRLLREENQRRHLRSCLSLTNRTTDRPEVTRRAATGFSSYDEFPTRDIDPSLLYYTAGNTFNREKTFTKSEFEDVFVAGSYKNVDLETLGRGRGRGRLQSVPGSDGQNRVIGIGRGRPFRL